MLKTQSKHTRKPYSSYSHRLILFFLGFLLLALVPIYNQIQYARVVEILHGNNQDALPVVLYLHGENEENGPRHQGYATSKDVSLYNDNNQEDSPVVLNLHGKNDENRTRHREHTIAKNSSLYNDNNQDDSPLLQATAGGQDDNKYLLYYTHSGFGNQVLAMERAAYLARATNRTLVLPPVLPHKSSKHDIFSKFKSRSAGKDCRPYDFYQKFIKKVQDDVQRASNPEILFPSLMEIFDFDDLTQKTGLNVVDMREFAKDSKNANFTHWCTPSYEIRKKMVRNCGKSETFTNLVPQFQQMCGSDHQQVAAIGSAFVIPVPEGRKKGSKFEDKVIPSHKLLSLLNQIHSRLPENYAAVSIRFKDDLVVDTCDNPRVKNAYKLVLRDLVGQNLAHKGHVLIGNSNRAALRCFHHHAQGNYAASTINDIIDSDGALQRMVNEIKLEKSTIYLMMDQILIGLAEKVAYGSVGKSASTFQDRIKVWHNRRDEILEKMRVV